MDLGVRICEHEPVQYIHIGTTTTTTTTLLKYNYLKNIIFYQIQIIYLRLFINLVVFTVSKHLKTHKVIIVLSSGDRLKTSVLCSCCHKLFQCENLTLICRPVSGLIFCYKLSLHTSPAILCPFKGTRGRLSNVQAQLYVSEIYPTILYIPYYMFSETTPLLSFPIQRL